MERNKEFTDKFSNIYPTLYRSLNSLFSSKNLGGISNINLGFDKKLGISCSVQLTSLPTPLSLEDMEHKGNLVCIHDSKSLMMKNYLISLLFPKNEYTNYFVCDLHELDMMRLRIDEFVNCSVLLLSYINIDKMEATANFCPTDESGVELEIDKIDVKLFYNNKYVSFNFPLKPEYLLSKYARSNEGIEQESQRAQTSTVGSL